MEITALSGSVFDGIQQATARKRIATEHAYLKLILAEHYKIGLEFKTGDDPTLLDNPKHAWIVVLGKPETPDIHMVQADAQPVSQV